MSAARGTFPHDFHPRPPIWGDPLCKRVQPGGAGPEPRGTLLQGGVGVTEAKGEELRGSRAPWAARPSPGAGLKVEVGRAEGCALGRGRKMEVGVERGAEKVQGRLRRLEAVPEPRLQLERSWYQESRVLCSRPSSNASALGKPVPQLGPQSPHV